MILSIQYLVCSRLISSFLWDNHIDKKTKNMNYIKRALMKCVILVPMGLSKTTIIFAFILVIGTLICLIDPRLRKNKVMLWDYATTMIVVEDGNSATL
jgi:hypothetical protein